MSNSFHEYMRKRQSQSSAIVDAAVAMGVPVFPCNELKRPLPGSHGFKDASTDPVRIRAMFARDGAVLIGLPTGAITGLVVVDVDVKDGAQGAAWLDANRERLVQTRTIRTGSGGLHLYFNHPGYEIKNSASKIAPGVDVRGDGGYVIVPPSPGYTEADNAPIADIPAWLLPALLPPEPAPAPALVPPWVGRGSSAPLPSDGGTPYALAALERECEAIRNAPDGTKHSALNKAAFAVGGLVTAGTLLEGVAFGALSAALQDIRPRCRDFRAAEHTLRNAFRDGMGQPRTIPELPPAPPPELNPAAGLIAKAEARAAAMRAPAPRVAAPAPQPTEIPIPVAVYDVDGVLKLMLEHCTASAWRPQPFLSLAAAITAVGAAAGRRYQTESGRRTNVYAAGIADSGSGKDHPLGYVRRALYAAGLDQYVGGEDITSGAGLLESLGEHPAKVWLIDEMGMFIASVTGKNTAFWKREVWDLLIKLFSRADDRYNGKEYANRKMNPRADIHNPHACLFGATTPSTFWEALEGGAMKDGSLARVLIFMTDKNLVPRNKDPAPKDIPEPIADALRLIARGADGHDHGGDIAAVMLSSTPMDAYTVPMDAAARGIMESFLDRQEAWQAEVANTPKSAVVARVGEHAAKLALIRAVSRDPVAPAITGADVLWAVTLTEHCANTLLRESARFMADTDYERKVNKLIEVITKHGPVTDAHIFGKHKFRLPQRERLDMLRDLVNLGQIVEVAPDPAKPGPKAIRYALAEREAD